MPVRSFLYLPIFEKHEDELLTLWLADKVYDVVKDGEVAIKAMHAAEDHVLKTKSKIEEADSNEHLFNKRYDPIY